MKKIMQFVVLAIAAGQLSACQTTGKSNPETSNKTKAERMEAAMEKASIASIKNKPKSANLLALSKKYKRNSSDPAIALKYAKSLRQEKQLERASMILSPFAKTNNAHAGIKTEMSSISLSLGNYDVAENYAKEAVLQDATDYQAYQNLGIALDAKEMHPEAERAFRKGLKNWKGDSTTIMNNLALNLATQGFIDEAIEVLERAKALSPERIEIERNLRIIRTLNEQ